MTEPLFYEKGNPASTLKLIQGYQFSASSSDPCGSYAIEALDPWFYVRSYSFLSSKTLHVCASEQEAHSFIAWHKRFIHKVNNPNIIYKESGSGDGFGILIAVICVVGFCLGFILDRIFS